MKGVIADWISSTLTRIGIGKILGYSHRYEIGDLADDDLVTKYLLLNTAGSFPIPPDPTIITGGVTLNPATVPYDGDDSTGYVLKRAADGSFDWNTNVTYDGSNFVITGDDDGTGHFADSFVFGIKP